MRLGARASELSREHAGHSCPSLAVAAPRSQLLRRVLLLQGWSRGGFGKVTATAAKWWTFLLRAIVSDRVELQACMLPAFGRSLARCLLRLRQPPVPKSVENKWHASSASRNRPTLAAEHRTFSRLLRRPAMSFLIRRSRNKEIRIPKDNARYRRQPFNGRLASMQSGQ